MNVWGRIMDALIDKLVNSGHIWGAIALAVLYFVILPRVDKLSDRHVKFLDMTDQKLGEIKPQLDRIEGAITDKKGCKATADFTPRQVPA